MTETKFGEHFTCHVTQISAIAFFGSTRTLEAPLTFFFKKNLSSCVFGGYSQTVWQIAPIAVVVPWWAVKKKGHLKTLLGLTWQLHFLLRNELIFLVKMEIIFGKPWD